MREAPTLSFGNSYAALSDGFHSRVTPRPRQRARLIGVSAEAAPLPGLRPADPFEQPMLAWLGGEAPMAGADPVAMCYAGHQFGHFVSQLGDGRAIVLGEAVTRAGESWGIQLKGGSDPLLA